MNVQNLKNVVTRLGGRGLLVTKKYSPQILTGLGLVSGVTSTVLASKATLRLEPIVDEIQEELQLIREVAREDNRDHLKETSLAYAKGSIKIVRLYAPAISVGVVGAGCIIGAQGIMQKRQAGLIAAYTAVERGFAEYRKRVEEALSPEQAEALRYGIDKKEKHNTKKGEVIVEEVISDPNGLSPYARFFDETSDNWVKNPEYNRLFLQSQQNYANDMLHARGHVFLNEVYDMLGLERSQAGSVVGWVLNKDGDNFVDFGIFRGDSERVREFVNGRERSILLDFNVDGVIFDKI